MNSNPFVPVSKKNYSQQSTGDTLYFVLLSDSGQVLHHCLLQAHIVLEIGTQGSVLNEAREFKVRRRRDNEESGEHSNRLLRPALGIVDVGEDECDENGLEGVSVHPNLRHKS